MIITDEIKQNILKAVNALDTNDDAIMDIVEARSIAANAVAYLAETDTDGDGYDDWISGSDWTACETFEEAWDQLIEAAEQWDALKDEIEPDTENIISAVLTAAEAAELYGLAEDTVRKTISRGQIPARKSGGTWLLLHSDAEKRWGKK